tara:strand:+ start:122 stop:406 length:285 start_codon:yes stop_codon:yes gene_type:complete
MSREQLYPLNRYLTVRPVEQKEKDNDEPQVLVPEGYYEESPSAYMVVEVLHANVDSKLKEGMWLLAPRSSLETAEFHGQTHYLLLENHVMGFLS